MASDCRLLLEDGSALLLEDGDNLLLENCTPSSVGTGCDLLTEDGGLLLQEDGFALLLENCGAASSVDVVSGGFVRVRPRRVVVELGSDDDDEALATSLLVLMRSRRWRLDG